MGVFLLLAASGCGGARASGDGGTVDLAASAPSDLGVAVAPPDLARPDLALAPCGNFRTTQYWPLPAPTADVLVADATGDGVPDIVWHDEVLVTVLPVSRKGGFPAPVHSRVGHVGAYAALADMDGDQQPDLVTTDGHGDLLIVYGAGGGAFSAAAQLPLGMAARSYYVGVANLDDDPSLDVLTAIDDQQAVPGSEAVAFAIAWNPDSGHLAPAESSGGVRGSDLADGPLLAADATGDGQLDLFTPAASALGDVALLVWVGPHAYKEPTFLSLGVRPTRFSVEDLDGDHRVDVFAWSYAHRDLSGADALVVALGHGDGSFAKAIVFDAGAPLTGYALGDISGDGVPDVVGTVADRAALAVAEGDGHGGFTPAYLCGLAFIERAPHLVDLDGDGHLDLVTTATVPPADGVAVLHVAH